MKVFILLGRSDGETEVLTACSTERLANVRAAEYAEEYAESRKEDGKTDVSIDVEDGNVCVDVDGNTEQQYQVFGTEMEEA